MATIFCFSSTGNSLFVAKKIASELNASMHSMAAPYTKCDDSIIGFIFPTYYLGLPKTVVQFISKLDITGKKPYLFAITTYGGHSFGISHAINELLSQKNLSLDYFNKIRSVENYILSPILSVDNSQVIHRATERKVKHIIKDILLHKQRKLDLYTPLNPIRYNQYPANNKNGFSPDFKINHCSGCGICEKICPRHNIHLINQLPTFSRDCELCLGCLHACPQDAINGKHSNGKKRYLHPQITKAELIHLNHAHINE